MIRFLGGGGGMNFFNIKMFFLCSEDMGVFYIWLLSEKKILLNYSFVGIFCD